MCFELLVWCKVIDCSFYTTEHMAIMVIQTEIWTIIIVQAEV